jgi:hypothetical protein
MKIFTLLAAMLITVQVYSQSQKGYYITNGGQKVEGYFKTDNFYALAMPEFKGSDDVDFKVPDYENIKEYGVENEFKFEKHTVDIDDTNNNNSNLSHQKDAVYVKKTIFLNVIVEGDASLYSYIGTNGAKYFFKVDSKNVPLSQLVFKRYLANQSATAENNHYRQQLFSFTKCDGDTMDKFIALKYERGALASIIESYNACIGKTAKIYAASRVQKLEINYTVFAGAGLTGFGLSDMKPSLDKTNKATISVGGEIALELPSKKWAIFARVSYEQLSAEATNSHVTSPASNITTMNTYAIDYKMFSLQLGPRCNFDLNDRNKLFVDASIGLGIPSGTLLHSTIVSNSTGTFSNDIIEYDLNSCAYFTIGAGYVFNDKFGIDLRFDTNKNMLNGSRTEFITKISRIGINLRYTLN